MKNGKTVRQVIEAQLAASKPELRPRTYNGYVAIYNNRILPKFGGRKVATLTRSDVQAWIGELHAAELLPATVHHHYVALKKALRHVLDDRLISYNPGDGVRLAKGSQRGRV